MPDMRKEGQAVTIAEAKKKVAALAAAQVGYHEKATNANLDSPTANAGSKDFTKYARDIDAISGFYNGKKQGVAWCDIFHDWLFVTCFGAELGRQMLRQPLKSSGAGCTSSANYYKKAGAFYSAPEVGDQIFFNASSGSGYGHTGTVVAVTDTTVETIEGNASDAVNRRTYKKTSGKIGGYGRPNWQLVEGGSTMDEQQTAPAAEPVAAQTVTVQAPGGGKVNLRVDANANSGLVNQISSGTVARVLADLGEWCFITTAKGSGYMMKKYLINTGGQAAAEQTPQEAEIKPSGGVLFEAVQLARQRLKAAQEAARAAAAAANEAADAVEAAQALLTDAG